MTGELRAELAAYLEMYYRAEEDIEGGLPGSGGAASGEEGCPWAGAQEEWHFKSGLREKESLTSDQVQSLKSLIGELEDSFHDRLFELIDESGLSDVDVYRRANLDRKLFSKIRSNPSYHPSKSTVLALAVALRLDTEETCDLLARAEYAFSPGSKSDLIVRFFIEHRIYDIDAINYTLDEYHLPNLNVRKQTDDK